VSHAGLLREVQVSERDEFYSVHHHEERPPGDPRYVPYLQHKDVQDRQSAIYYRPIAQ